MQGHWFGWDSPGARRSVGIPLGQATPVDESPHLARAEAIREAGPVGRAARRTPAPLASAKPEIARGEARRRDPGEADGRAIAQGDDGVGPNLAERGPYLGEGV